MEQSVINVGTAVPKRRSKAVDIFPVDEVWIRPFLWTTYWVSLAFRSA